MRRASDAGTSIRFETLEVTKERHTVGYLPLGWRKILARSHRQDVASEYGVRVGHSLRSDCGNENVEELHGGVTNRKRVRQRAII